MLADEAHRMRFVDQHHRAILLRDANHFLQRGDVAEHRIDAFEDDELAGALGDAFQALFERFDVIVAEGHDLRVAHGAAVVDRGVAVDVEDDVIVLAGDGRNHPEVRLIAGREDYRMVHCVEVHERLLDRLVAGISAIKDAAARGAGAEFLQRFLACGDHVRIEGHAHVIVGAEQDGAPAAADGDGRALDPLHHQVEGVGEARFEQGLALIDQRVEFGQEVGHGGLCLGGNCGGFGSHFEAPAGSRPSVAPVRRPADRPSRSRPACSSR